MPTIQLFVPNVPQMAVEGDGCGRYVELDIFNPDELIGSLSLVDLCQMLGHGLAGTNRYGCHTPTRMSTAAHTALGAGWVLAHPDRAIPQDQDWPFARTPLWGMADKHELAIKFMIHDAAEGLGLCDVPTPYKQALGLELFERLEGNLCSAVSRRLESLIEGCPKHALDPGQDGRVKVIDRSILVDETRALMKGPLGPHWDFLKDHKPLGLRSDQFLPWLGREAQSDLHTRGWAWGMLLHKMVYARRGIMAISRIGGAEYDFSISAGLALAGSTEVYGLDIEGLPEHLADRVKMLLRLV